MRFLLSVLLAIGFFTSYQSVEVWADGTTCTIQTRSGLVKQVRLYERAVAKFQRAIEKTTSKMDLAADKIQLGIDKLNRTRDRLKAKVARRCDLSGIIGGLVCAVEYGRIDALIDPKTAALRAKGEEIRTQYIAIKADIERKLGNAAQTLAEKRAALAACDAPRGT